MGWEWRAFLPSCAQFDLWSEIGPKLVPGRVEMRTDWYVPATADFGVKLRSGRTIEVKERTAVHESGCEAWKKVVVERANFTDEQLASGSILAEVYGAVLPLVSALRKSESACTALRPAEKCVVKLEKRRRQWSTWRVSVEQTDIDVILVTADRPARSAGSWRSVCVESGRIDDVTAKLMEWKLVEKLSKLDSGSRAITAQSYAVFVCTLAESMQST